MRRSTLLLLLLATLGAVAAPADASADRAALRTGIPDWAYLQPFEDTSAVADVPRWTSFSRSGPGTIVATTWYTAWNGRTLRMVVAYPARRTGVRLPLVRVFHGAGGRATCGRTFGNTPGRYGFAIACLDGAGRRTRGYSYGAPGSVDDYARIIGLIRDRLPGLRIDPARQVAAGSSMGAQEALLFAARHPGLVQTVVAMDAPVDLGRRFWHLSAFRQQALFTECGGTPDTAPDCYREGSPLTYAADLARGDERLLLYWSTADSISRREQLPALAQAIHAADPGRRFAIGIGLWAHGQAWPPARRNLEWLVDVGLAPRGTLGRSETRVVERIDVSAATDLSSLPAYGS